MALETLKGVEKINGRTVITMDTLREKHPERFTETGAMDHVWFEKDIRPNAFIYVRHDKNSLAFTLQNGPVKENGVNGCQVVDVIAAAATMIRGLNKQFPHPANERTLTHLESAIAEQDRRTREREERGVEGTSQH